MLFLKASPPPASPTRQRQRRNHRRRDRAADFYFSGSTGLRPGKIRPPIGNATAGVASAETNRNGKPSPTELEDSSESFESPTADKSAVASSVAVDNGSVIQQAPPISASAAEFDNPDVPAPSDTDYAPASSDGFAAFDAPTETVAPAASDGFAAFDAPTETTPAASHGFAASSAPAETAAPAVSHGFAAFSAPAETAAPAASDGFAAFDASTETAAPAASDGFATFDAPTETAAPAASDGFATFDAPTETAVPVILPAATDVATFDATAEAPQSILGRALTFDAPTETTQAEPDGFAAFSAPAETAAPAASDGFAAFDAPTETAPAASDGFAAFGAPTETAPAASDGFAVFSASAEAPAASTPASVAAPNTPVETPSSAPSAGTGAFDASAEAAAQQVPDSTVAFDAPTEEAPAVPASAGIADGTVEKAEPESRVERELDTTAKISPDASVTSGVTTSKHEATTPAIPEPEPIIAAPLMLKAALDEEMVCEATATSTLRMQVVGTATVAASPWPTPQKRYVLRLEGLTNASVQVGALAKVTWSPGSSTAAAAASNRIKPETPAASTGVEAQAHIVECLTPARPSSAAADSATNSSSSKNSSPFAAVLRYKLKKPRAPPLRIRCAVQPKGSNQAMVSIELTAAASLTSPLMKVTVTLALPPPPPTQNRASSRSGPQTKPPAAWSTNTLTLRWPAANASLALKPGERKVFQALVTCPEGASIGPVVTQCECASLLSGANATFTAHPDDDAAAVVGKLAHRRFRINHKLVLE